MTLVVATWPPVGASAREKCSSALITSITLAGFHPKGTFYVATESQGGSFTVRRDGDNCAPGEWTDVPYSLEDVTTEASDLSPKSGKVRLYAPTDSESGDDTKSVNVTVNGEITAVEKAMVRLGEPEHSGGDSPVVYASAAPLYVIDTDSPSSIVLGETSISQKEGLTVRLPVFRTGPVSGDSSVGFSVVPGTALPGEDYQPPSSSALSFTGGSRVEVISIDLLADDFEEGEESFTVVLEDGPGAPREATVTIVDATAEDLRPKGKLHHPKQAFKYPQNYPWLNEIHIFTSSADERDFKVDKAQLAIRKRWKSDSCAWWTPNGFKRSDCEEVHWFGKGVKNPDRNYFKYKIRQKLPRSVGRSTKVRDYKIWGRWYDTEDRVSILKKGRNLNRFDVIKPTKACSNAETRFNFRKCKPVRP